MLPACAYSSNSPSGPYFGWKFKPRHLLGPIGWPSSSQSARDTSQISHWLSYWGIGAPSAFTKSDFLEFTSLFSFPESLVDLEPQIISDILKQLSEGFRGSSEVVLIGFNSILYNILRVRESPRSLLGSTNPLDVPDFSSFFRSPVLFNLIHDNEDWVYAARLQQTSGGTDGPSIFTTMLQNDQAQSSHDSHPDSLIVPTVYAGVTSTFPTPRITSEYVISPHPRATRSTFSHGGDPWEVGEDGQHEGGGAGFAQGRKRSSLYRIERSTLTSGLPKESTPTMRQAMITFQKHSVQIFFSPENAIVDFKRKMKELWNIPMKMYH
jgi:hypothetical protein